jgi:hypothetical protein
MARLRDPYDPYRGTAVPTAPTTYPAPQSTAQDTTQTTTAPNGTHTPYEDGGVTGGMPSGVDTHYISGNSGWDPSKLADTTHTTDKYKIGRVADRFNAADVRKDPTAFMRELRAAGYDPKQLSDDRWDFGGDIGYVDLIRGDNSWWWGQDGPGGGTGAGGGGEFPGIGGGAPAGGWSGYGAGGGGGSSSSHPYDAAGVMEQLKKLFPDGAFNQDIVNRRVSNASDALNRNRKSQLATTQAFLADRGQGVNDGTFGSAVGNLETRLGENFNSSVNDIYASEGEAADQRMIQALQIAAGMTEEEARNAVDYARINSDNSLGWGNIGLGYRNAGINERLGLGNLALGNLNAGNQYSLGLGQLGLGRDTLLENSRHSTMDEYIRLLESYLTASNQSREGHN